MSLNGFCWLGLLLLIIIIIIRRRLAASHPRLTVSRRNLAVKSFIQLGFRYKTILLVIIRSSTRGYQWFHRTVVTYLLWPLFLCLVLFCFKQQKLKLLVQRVCSATIDGMCACVCGGLIGCERVLCICFLNSKFIKRAAEGLFRYRMCLLAFIIYYYSYILSTTTRLLLLLLLLLYTTTTNNNYIVIIRIISNCSNIKKFYIIIF